MQAAVYAQYQAASANNFCSHPCSSFACQATRLPFMIKLTNYHLDNYTPNPSPATDKTFSVNMLCTPRPHISSSLLPCSHGVTLTLQLSCHVCRYATVVLKPGNDLLNVCIEDHPEFGIQGSIVAVEAISDDPDSREYEALDASLYCPTLAPPPPFLPSGL